MKNINTETNMHRAILILLILIVVSFSICCSNSDNEANIYGVHLKQECWSNSGELTACYNGRIYYLAGTDIDSKIYSMNENGKDIKLEFTGQNIHNIVVFDDCIYFIQENGDIYKKSGHRYVINKLYKKNLSTGKIYEVEVPYAYEGQTTILRAYIGENKAMIIKSLEALGYSHAPVEVYHIVDESSKIREANIDLEDTDKIIIKECEDFIFEGSRLESEYMDADDIESLDRDGNKSFYVSSFTAVNKLFGEVIADNQSLRNRRLVYTDDKYLFCLYNDNLILLNRIDLSEYKDILIPKDDSEVRVSMIFPADEGYYVYGYEKETEFGQSDASSEILWYVDEEVDETKEVIQLSAGEKLVGICSGLLIYIDNDILVCRKLNGSAVDSISYEYQLSKSLLDNGAVEMAGEWIFIYLDGQKGEEGVLYKINPFTQMVLTSNY